jgi:hypothetical protein
LKRVKSVKSPAITSVAPPPKPAIEIIQVAMAIKAEIATNG